MHFRTTFFRCLVGLGFCLITNFVVEAQTNTAFDIDINEEHNPELNWNAELDRTYTIDFSSDLRNFRTIATGFPAGGAIGASLSFVDKNVDSRSTSEPIGDPPALPGRLSEFDLSCGLPWGLGL